MLGHLGGGAVSLRTDIEVSKAHTMSTYLSLSFSLMLLNEDVNSQLLLQNHACLTAAMLLTVVVMDSYETVSPEQTLFFHKSLRSWCLITVRKVN